MYKKTLYIKGCPRISETIKNARNDGNGGVIHPAKEDCIMKITKGRLVRGLGLTGMLALCLLLTGCVVPPDDLEANGGYVVSNGDLPFQSVKPSITGTPTPTATATPTPSPFSGITLVTSGASTATPTVTPTRNPLQNIITVTSAAGPTKTPAASSSTLKKGSTGADVKKLQTRLKELGYLKGSADGDFGDATEAAVKAFQAQNGLTVDGKAGANTQTKLYSDSAKKATTATATNTSKPTATPFTSYKKGDSGSEIKRVQQRLKELGYLTGSADGDFGDKTEAAVRAFQSRNGLTVDGKVGKNTLSKLFSDSAKKAATATPTPTTKPTNTPKPTATPTPKPTNTPKPTATPRVESLTYYLKLGSSGTKVKTLQTRLIQLGWLTGTADGSYGSATEYAVKAFQARYSSLWTDGIAGPDTLKILYGAGAATSSTPAASLGMSLDEGATGGAVKAMQKRLKELGFYTRTADGSYGSVTKSAVIAFQKANGLTASGTANTATLNKLYSNDAKNADALKDEEDAKKEEDGDVSGAQDPEDATGIVVGGYTTLRQGDSGDAVKKLQTALKNRGYYSNSVDGNYGYRTVAAVKTFQEKNGLKADGVAGPATQSLLYGTSASSADTNVSLKKGSTGADVRNLQYVLYELGYFDGQIDGVYADTTVDAVRAFQINNSVTPVDGVAGPKTLKVIYSSEAIGATAASGNYTALKKGDNGTLVVELQESLASLGYLAEVTGTYDSATVAAVKNFQSRNGLTVDGNAGKETQKVLYGGDPTPAW